MLKLFKSGDLILLIKIPLSTVTGNAAKLRRFQPSKIKWNALKSEWLQQFMCSFDRLMQPISLQIRVFYNWVGS